MKSKSVYILGWMTLAVWSSPLAGASVLYNNASEPLGKNFALGVEFGDQVILDTGTLPSARINSLTFEYFLSGTVNLGNEQAQIRMYQNDGVDGQPGSMLFDSLAFNIVPTAGSSVLIQGLDVEVNRTFTWTIAFSGIDPVTESAGMPLYSPPSIGNNYTDYWEKTGGNVWTLKTIEGTDASFPAIFTGAAIPEVSVFWQWMTCAGVSGLFLHRRMKNKSRKQKAESRN